MKIINIIITIGILILFISCGNSNIYYVDSVNGDDSYSGTSELRPWKSLTKLNQHTFKPGDQILFKAGTVYEGQFEPQGSGNEKNLSS